MYFLKTLAFKMSLQISSDLNNLNASSIGIDSCLINFNIDSPDLLFRIGFRVPVYSTGNYFLFVVLTK